MARKKLFQANENLGGLAAQIDNATPAGDGFTPAMAGVAKTDLEKQIENQLPDSEQVDLKDSNGTKGTTLESLGIDLSAGISDAACAMVESQRSSSEGNEMDQTLFVQTEEMQPLTDMFFVLQKMHGGLMQGHANIEDPDDSREVGHHAEIMMSYEEFGDLANEITRLTGSTAALEAHYSTMPMSAKIKIALEDVESGKKGVLTKAFEILVKYIKRLIEWLIGPRKEKSELAGKVAAGPMQKIMKSMSDIVTGRNFSSLTKEDRDDLSKTITSLPMGQQIWFFNGRHVDDRLKIASDAAVHKLFADGSLLHVIFEMDDALENADDAEKECNEILKKYNFIAESKALAAQDLHDVGSDVSIHDLRDINKIYQILDHRSALIKEMKFVVDSKLDDKILNMQKKWLADLEAYKSGSSDDADNRKRIVRQKQIEVVGNFLKVQDKILDDIVNYHKAALAIVRWTATTIESKLKTTDSESDRHKLRQLKADTVARLSELEKILK